MADGAPRFRVRRLGPADAAAYRAIRLHSLRVDPGSFGTLWQDERERPLEHFAETLGRADAVAAIAGDVMVGVARLHDGPGSTEQPGGTINGVFVVPEQRGRGIARAMLRALLARADERLPQVTLSVTPTNHAAIALYESLGFRAYGCEPRARKAATRGTDTLLMMRRSVRPPP